MQITDSFVTWGALATYGGCLAMTLLLTQFTKNLPFIIQLPTQIWSYILALAVLIPALYFTGQLDASNAALTLFNAAIISLAANGGYAALERVTGGKQ